MKSLRNLFRRTSKKQEEQPKEESDVEFTNRIIYGNCPPNDLLEKLNPVVFKACKGILLGTAVGDALGFPVQFLDRETVKKDPVVDMTSGKWSDDTSLSLCLADSLCGGYNLQDIADKFIRWLLDGLWTPRGKAFDIGVTTCRAIANLNYGINPNEAGLDRERDNGNGSLMRISPLVPYIYSMPEEQQNRIITEVSSLTHRHPRSILSCIFLCKFELQFIKHKDIPTAFSQTQEEIKHLLQEPTFQKETVHFKRLVDYSFEEFKNIPEPEIKSSGYVIDTLEASLWSLFNHDNFQDTLLCAVNLGDDADTVGAVTGAMAGLVYGPESIPSEWIDRLARKEDIIRLAQQVSRRIVFSH